MKRPVAFVRSLAATDGILASSLAGTSLAGASSHREGPMIASGAYADRTEASMVLLVTIAVHRALFGLLLLIVAFSAGVLIVAFSSGVLIVAFGSGVLSVVFSTAELAAFGLLLASARGFFGRIDLSSGLAPRLLPVASAPVIRIARCVVTAQALPQVL